MLWLALQIRATMSEATTTRLDSNEKNEDALLRIRHAMCCGKMAYGAMDLAQAGVERLNRKFGKDEQALSGYYCVFCNYHHIGRSPKSSSLKILSDIARLLQFNFGEPCDLCRAGCNPRRHKHHGSKPRPIMQWEDDGGSVAA